MDMARAIIFEENIDDDLWPKIIFVITQVKNVRSTYILEIGNSYQVLLSKPPNVTYLQVLGLIIYVFIHEEK